jgi:hypothetical protein
MSDGYIGESSAPVAPDLIEEVVGVRGFDRAGHMLASPFQGGEWKQPGQRAVCRPDRKRHAAALMGLGQKPPKANSAAAAFVARQQRLRRHAAPHVNCACGLYAFHSIAESEAFACGAITAAVQAWGKLVVHKRGFRAEHMRVVALALHDDLEPGVPGQRYREVARRASAWWKVPLLGLDELAASLTEFGSPVPDDMKPREEEESS